MLSLRSLIARLRRSTRPQVPVTLFSRPDCGLCDEMQAEMERARLGAEYELRIVDVDSERPLKKRYGLRIPVLAIAGEDVFEGRLTAEDFALEFGLRAERYHRALRVESEA